MESIVHRVELLLNVLLHKYLSDDVACSIQQLKSAIPGDYVAKNAGKSLKFDECNTDRGSIHKYSFFKKFFYNLSSSIKESSKLDNMYTTTSERNVYYSLKFKRYLMKENDKHGQKKEQKMTFEGIRR
ncbi:unnamed protein product [Allacma fusca]|uniref:Uncharacterized protein n=1 Tax=Allacma fusca TaxID=39272 RepID=A0A8J2P0R0_9HEXA|nr:unnamed protein product [Allacma fusca]